LQVEGDADLYKQRLLAIVNGSACAGRKYGFSLGHLAQLAQAVPGPSYPPTLPEVLGNCLEVGEGEQRRNSYVNLLKWLRHLVRRASARHTLSAADGKARDRVLAEMQALAEGCSVQLSASGIPVPKSGVLGAALDSYRKNPYRVGLLERLAGLRSGRVGKYLLPDGRDMLQPHFSCSLLVLELFLGSGKVSPGAVAGCSLADYNRRVGTPVPRGSSDPPQRFAWEVSASERERLEASLQVSRALDGFVSFLRPNLMPARRLPPGKRVVSLAAGPLLPGSGGTTLASLSHAFDLFFELAGARPPGVDLQQRNIGFLRDLILSSAE
jgi:hypothetical protein